MPPRPINSDTEDWGKYITGREHHAAFIFQDCKGSQGTFFHIFT